ncbi:hypothetical protein QTP86_005278 [Hemibagrus guttatus]|nr:hypothetical protein QTP86_005278 [Hemibagrus guttatus]
MLNNGVHNKNNPQLVGPYCTEYWDTQMSESLSMTIRASFILPLLQIWICLLVAESTSKCFIKDDEAYCVLRKLDEVPVLPPNITYLDLTLNYISEIHEKSFHGLEKLQILMIQQQEVRLVLRNNAFSGLSNLIKLDLAYNKNLRVDPGAFNGLFNLQILNLTECKLYDSILSGDYLRPLVSLEQLSLAGNNIRKIRPASFFTNMSKLHVVDISHNWINSFCEEDLFHFQEELMCEFPEMQQGKPLLHAKLCEDVEDEKMIEKLKLTLFICCTMLIILNTTGPITFVHLRGYCFKFYRKVIVRFVDGGPKVAANDDFMYDVYLCFSSKDIKWVTKALLEKLDTQFSDQNELRCCFEARDFIPGEDHLSNIYNAIWKSKKTLFILSREFFKDGWCLEAFSLAQTKMLEELQDVSLVLLVDNIPHYKLMKYELFRTYFQTRRHLCWPEDYQDLEWFYSHLKQSILKDTKVKRKSLSMKGRPSSFILPLLQIWICLLVEESTSKCFIKDDKAYCALRKLDEVPVLPPNITYLDLTLNYISEIHEKSFHGLEKLQILMIQQQEVRLVLRNNAFSGLSNLIKLDLAYNTNLRVDPGAFNGLFNLQILNLTECKLYDSILSGDYLRPLVSLEQLSLAGNNIRKIRPASFFADMSKLHVVDISHNWINSFCEEDLFHFQGKHFTLLKLHDIKMSDMNPYWGSWNKCGNPFKNMSMTVLDLSLNGFSVDRAVLFFRAIRGTKIHILILNHSGSMGKGVWYDNTKDPDRNTFMDLAESGIKALDLSKASIFTLKNAVFSYMPDLVEISIARNFINQIIDNAFYGLDNLRMLNLSNNLLDKIDSETFKNLESLETLDLSNNNIRMLSPQSFQGLPKLANLLLSENSIQSLHTLENLPSLNMLYLDNNKIQTLFGLPSQARNTKIINLQYNRLSNAENLYMILVEFPNIEIIYLGGNTFSHCVLDADYSVSPLNNVQILDLHMTGLQNIWLKEICLDIFDHLHQLQMLLLNNNYIQSLPENIFKGLSSLNFLDLSFNSLTYVPTGIFPESLRILNLAFNNLGSVDPQAFSTLTLISLQGNRFICDCGLRDLQTWLNETDVQMYSPAEELMCEFPEMQQGKPLLHAKLCEDVEDEKMIEKLKLTLFICCTMLIILNTTGPITFVRLHGYCFKFYRKVIVRFVDGGPKVAANDDFMYDVYLCFSSKDIKWVTKALLEKLDTQFSDQNELRCCFEARDFIPGEDHLSNMRNAIWKSKKTLFILSREFFKDGWCLEAFSLAQTKMQKEVQDVSLVLLVDNIPHYRLMKYEPVRTYFQTRRHLCWPEDYQDLEWFYSHLKQSILKDTKVKRKVKIDVDVETNYKEKNCEAVTAL